MKTTYNELTRTQRRKVLEKDKYSCRFCHCSKKTATIVCRKKKNSYVAICDDCVNELFNQKLDAGYPIPLNA